MKLVNSNNQLYRQKKINLSYSAPDGFTSFSADNVDHTIISLNGLGTFQGMGIISMTVPCPGSDNFTLTEKPVKRLPCDTIETSTRRKDVVIHHYNSPNIPPMSLLKFDPIPDIQSPYISPPSVKMELVWKISHVFRGNRIL